MVGTPDWRVAVFSLKVRDYASSSLTCLFSCFLLLFSRFPFDRNTATPNQHCHTDWTSPVKPMLPIHLKHSVRLWYITFYILLTPLYSVRDSGSKQSNSCSTWCEMTRMTCNAGRNVNAAMRKMVPLGLRCRFENPVGKGWCLMYVPVSDRYAIPSS